VTGFNLFVGNRMENLAGKLAAVLTNPPASPFMPEILVVQSRGMERWVSMQLAAASGICANVRFPFPRAIIQELFQAVLPAGETQRVFDPELAAWRIHDLLAACSSRPGFEPLSAYLARDDQGLKRYQLSRKIAQLFDQYLIFRPEMILNWEQGIIKNEEERWQADLWHHLAADGRTIHPAALRRSFHEALGQEGAAFPGLPERLSLFGISYLPPFYLEIFQAVSPFLEVNLFLLNPSREFWFDIRSSREISRRLLRIADRRDEGLSEGRDDRGPDEGALYLEEGNSLLASLGTLGREFWSYLSDFPSREEELYTEPGEDSLLAAIQSDILNLRERMGEGIPLDRSVQISACHSPMREVEVLFDSLLALLEEDPTLQPHDIVVMAPDIEAYAPFIAAVFDTTDPVVPPAEAPPKIPYHIADRTGIGGSPLLEGLLTLLKLPLGRLTAGEVLSLLEVDAIRNRFGLTEEDVDRIAGWVADCGIRWGIDGRSRLREGLPGIAANSWRWGLERLLLGYALPAREDELFCGILPFEIGEGSEPSLLGTLATFTERLFATVESLAESRSPADWGQVLEEIRDGFFQGVEADEEGLGILRRLPSELRALQEETDFTGKISLAVLRSWLGEQFYEPKGDSGFLSRGVTFCSLLPMRSIPFRVICLLGLNNGDYPRRPLVPGFDLMARHHRPGDRSRRNDDRYLFLEALLSAREILYLSYVGQSMADNSRIPPSVVVSELLDTIRRGSAPGQPDPEAFLVAFHPLQAFSPANFKGQSSRFFSFSAENCRAALALQSRQPGAATPEREREELPEPTEGERQVSVSDLVAFFRSPARYFLKRRLGVRLTGAESEPEESEPFELEGLERYGVEQLLLEREIAMGNLEDLYPVLSAGGLLPHGAVGRSRFLAVSGEIRSFVHRHAEVLRGEPRSSFDLDLEVGGFRLSGKLEGLRSRGLVHYRYTTLKGKDFLKLWLMHLLLQVARKREGNAPESLLLGKGEAWIYPSTAGAHCIVEKLLFLYREGLRRPLHFFPETSLAYATQRIKGAPQAQEGEESSLQAARTAWEGSPYRSGEGCEESYRLVFGDGDPLDGEFRKLALSVYGPLLEAVRKEKEAS